MKTRVTFRVATDLADALRDLPNQTAFVEQALRDALRDKCPVCGGTGRAEGALHVSNFREQSLPRLERETALQLRSIVSMARRSAATKLELRPVRGGLSFAVVRGAELLLQGTLSKPGARLAPVQSEVPWRS